MIRTSQDVKEIKFLIDKKSTGANIHDCLNLYYNISSRVKALESIDSFWDEYKEEYRDDIDEYEVKLYNLLNKKR